MLELPIPVAQELNIVFWMISFVWLRHPQKNSEKAQMKSLGKLRKQIPRAGSAKS